MTTKRRQPEPAGSPVAKRWERRSQARPGEIVAAAATLFADRGFAATRVEDVAARAGVTKATVYLYFADKQRLFEAVVRQALAPNIDRAEALVAGFEGTTPELLRMLLAFFEALLATEYTATAKMIVAESGTFPELARMYLDLVLSRGLALIADILRRGIARGELRAVSPEATAPVIMGPVLMLGLWKHSFAPHTDILPPPAEVLREHLELLVRGLALPAPAPEPKAKRRR